MLVIILGLLTNIVLRFTDTITTRSLTKIFWLINELAFPNPLGTLHKLVTLPEATIVGTVSEGQYNK